MTPMMEKQIKIRMKSADHWLELVMAPAGDHETGPFLYYPNQFHLNIEPTDTISHEYTLQNWEAGLLSGIFYGSRRCKRAPSNWLVVRLEGRLGCDSMDALAHAASTIVSREGGEDKMPAILPGWVEEQGK